MSIATDVRAAAHRAVSRPGRPAATRLSVVFHHDSHGYGGMEVYLFRLIDSLDPEAFRTALLVPGSTDGFRSSDPAVLGEARDRGIPLLRPADPGRTRGLSAVREVVATAGLLREWGADVVHIHTCRPSGARKVTLATRLAGVAGLVRTEHFPPSAIARPSDRYRVWPLDRLTDRVIAGSHGDRAEQVSMLRRPAAKVVTSHNSVDPSALDPAHDVGEAKQRVGLDPGLPVVLNVGRLVEQKGQRFLIAALPQVLERLGPVQLVIVGDGPLQGELVALCRALGIADHVHFVGFQKDVLPFMHAADVGAMPSLFEVFSLAMLELMALGKPIVASDHSSFLEAITPGREGLIVPRRQSGPLADALVRVLEDPDLATSLGAAATRRVQAEFTLDRLANDMAAIYRDVSNHERRRAS